MAEQDMDSVEARCAERSSSRGSALRRLSRFSGTHFRATSPSRWSGARSHDALECRAAWSQRGRSRKKELQLKRLLRMRDSVIPIERRFADIVLEKADVKYWTVTSW